MVIKRRLAGALAAAVAAVGLLAAGTLPAAQAAPAAVQAQPAMRMMHLHAGLRGGHAYPRAGGHADFQSGNHYRHLDVSMWNIRQLAGRTLIVYVHGTRAGTMTVTRDGRAHMYRASGTPQCQPGQPVRVRTRNGTLVASGTFHR